MFYWGSPQASIQGNMEWSVLLEIDRAVQYVKNSVSPERFQHSLGVKSCAAKIARQLGLDPDKASLAGILHDIARDIPDGDLLRIAQLKGIIPRREDMLCPVLLHGKVGAALVRDELGITDQDVLMAIASHVTGRSGWTGLEQVIYVADKIEPGRRYPGVDKLRKLVEVGRFDLALRECLRNAIIYAARSERLIDPETVVVFNETSEASPEVCG